MESSPYRVAAAVEDPARPATGSPDASLLVVAAVIWFASLARVAEAFMRGEGPGQEPALALILVLVLPLLARPSR